MPLGGMTSQPIGHYDFCQERPVECQVLSDDTTPAVLTEASWRELQEVNNLVNAAIVPVTDQELFGEPEVWFYPNTRGDCEDYVLLKRRILIDQGWHEADLLITVVRRPDGEGHAVLTVRTDRGDFVLDNLEADIRLWSDTDYVFIKRQAEGNTGRWQAIEDGRSVPPLVVGDNH
jgi:predicted transglutaminase-like cysteine proteinase